MDNPQNHLAIIAIDRYREMPPLRGPGADAAALKAVLYERYGFAPERTLELRDEAATGAGIRRVFAELAGRACAAGDRLLVFYAGHGHQDRWKNGHWIPHDGGRDEYEQRGWIANSSLRAMVRDLPFRHVLLVCDSCFSGDLLDAERDLATLHDRPDFAADADKLVSREVISSGSSEPVTDLGFGGHSPFAFHLVQTLRHCSEPWLDRLRLYEPVRTSIVGQTPLQGTLPAAGHQRGGAFLLFPSRELARADECKDAPAPSPAVEPVPRFSVLEATSEPPGAEILLDGGAWEGTTPCEWAKVPWGQHGYRARLGNERIGGRFEVADYEHALSLRFPQALAAAESEAKAREVEAKKKAEDVSQVEPHQATDTGNADSVWQSLTTHMASHLAAAEHVGNLVRRVWFDIQCERGDEATEADGENGQIGQVASRIASVLCEYLVESRGIPREAIAGHCPNMLLGFFGLTPEQISTMLQSRPWPYGPKLADWFEDVIAKRIVKYMVVSRLNSYLDKSIPDDRYEPRVPSGGGRFTSWASIPQVKAPCSRHPTYGS